MTGAKLHIVHTENSCGWGGQEIRILTESAGMIARGHNVTILCPFEARIYSEAQKRGIPVVALPIARKNLTGLLALRRWLAQHRPDVVNTHSSTDSWLTLLALLFSANTIPVVRTRHISAPVSQTLPNRWLYGRAIRQVVTTGEALRLDLIERLRLPPDHAVSIPTGIDLTRYNRSSALPSAAARATFGIAPQARVVGIAATLRSWKGHDYLLDAVALLYPDFPDLELLIVGDGPRREHLETRIQALAPGLREKIHLVGHRDDVENALAAMDIFALPSYANEGVPQALMQAMAMELPVVSTAVGAIGELVDETSGFLVAPKEAAPLAQALARLLADAALREKLGQGGKQTVEKRYSLERMLDGMEAVFRLAIVRP
ncbi:MAG: glycosyltransferase [Sulfuricellaceae bacterium]